jgi:LysR family transcriptional regulator, nitrogen assimilation regulatory protein
MKLRQLRYFLHVAEFGSVTKASTYLRIAQPAVSRTIRDLEAELGVPLFDRHGRGVTLTEPGKDLLIRAEQIFIDLEKTKQEVMAHADIIEGSVTLGVPPSFGVAVAPHLVSRCRQAHPRLNLRIIESFSVFVQDWLIGGQADVAVLNAHTISRSLMVEPLVTDRMFVIGRPDKLSIRTKHVGLRDLAPLDLVMPSRSHGLRMIVDDAALSAGVQLNPVLEIDSVMMIKELVLQGEGVAILPLPTAWRELEAGWLVAKPITRPEVRRNLVLATSVDRPPGRAVRAVMELITEQVYAVACDSKMDTGFLLEE